MAMVQTGRPHVDRSRNAVRRYFAGIRRHRQNLALRQGRRRIVTPDNPAQKKPRFNSPYGLAIVGALFLTQIQDGRKESCMGNIPFTYAGVDEKTAWAFEKSFCAATETVSAWWGGETFTGKYKVDVQPIHEISMALVPVWQGYRGDMVFPTSRVNEARAAITHEITHVIAPNQNRFLAEGLAVYAQAKLGTNPAYPNFGRQLDQAVQPYLDKVGLSALDAIATPGKLEIETIIDGRGAYLIAGSFVKFLIERHGMEKFKALYAMTPLIVSKKGHGGKPARWKKVYGQDLANLEREWRTAIGEKATPKRKPGAVPPRV